MDRRELLKMIAMVTGGAVIAGELFLTGCKPGSAAAIKEFSKEDIAFLDEIGETILPRTGVPGAKDAAVGQFMTVMVNDCYTSSEQQVFHKGMSELDKACRKMHDTGFMDATPLQRHDLLLVLDKEARQQQEKKSLFDNEQKKIEAQETAKGNINFKKETMDPHYFTMMKQLTLLGFFTSRVGASEALRFVAVPGRYDACIPYKKGDRAWA